MNEQIKAAIDLLKDLVKESHIKGQMHIDLTLAPASRQEEYKTALLTIRQSISLGELTESEFKESLGLI